MDDLSGAVADARAVRDAWLRWLEDGRMEAYEAYVAAAAPLAERLAPLMEALAEGGLLAVSCEDGTGRFLRLAVEAAAEEDARFVLYAGTVTERSEELPALDDLSGGRGEMDLLLSPGTGDAIDRLTALEAALRADGHGARAGEAAAIRALLGAGTGPADG